MDLAAHPRAILRIAITIMARGARSGQLADVLLDNSESANRAVYDVIMNSLFTHDRLDRRSRRQRNTRRVRQIASVAVRYGLADYLRKMPGKRMQHWLRGAAGQNIAELSTAVRIRLALAEIGTTFIKFGQMLSTRPIWSARKWPAN